MSEQLIATPGVFGENGNFLLERELGTGGMGGVYMGRDKMLDRQVAVKVMLREFGSDPEFLEKFKKEAQSAARLIHPNIAQIYSYGICDGMPYISMELASGGSLYSIMNISKGSSNIPRVLKICQQVAQALQCASDQGFVHGDVKPENILLDSNGNAKLVDFGLAGMQKDTDEIWGTPYYISPEKVRKETVDFRSDMYCLGGTLYHALTGVAPFEGEDSVAVVKKRFEGAPKKPSEIRPEITPAIDNLVMKMLAFEKENRFPSFEALIKAFSDVLTTGLTSQPENGTTIAPAGKPTATAVKRVPTRMVRGPRTAMVKKTTLAKPVKGAKIKKISNDEEEYEDEEGSVLGKTILIIIAVIVAIGAVIGGLIWFSYASDKKKEQERMQLICSNIAKARDVIGDLRKSTESFRDEFVLFSRNATVECEKITGEIAKLLPDTAAFLKPAPTKELLDAINSTNTAAHSSAPAAASTNAPPAAAASTNAPPAAAASTNAPSAAATAPAEEKTLAKAEEKKLPSIVDDVQELWERAYSCQASTIKIVVSAKKILEECDKAGEIKDESEEAMRSLGEISITIKDQYDRLVSSDDVSKVRKGIGYIKSRGNKMVEQTVKRLRIEKLEAERKAKAEAAAAAEKERLKKMAEERKALIEAETAKIKDKFIAITAMGCLRQLDWKSAERQLNSVKETFETAEGSLAADIELKKVYAMKSVQDIFIRKMKGHVFKGRLKGCEVVDISEEDIQIRRPKADRVVKLSWQKFYRDFPGNLNEVINHYIVNGRKNSDLNLKSWTEAMIGSALTMQLVCSEVNGAMERANQLIQEAVKQFPDYIKTAQEIFPEMKFQTVEEE